MDAKLLDRFTRAEEDFVSAVLAGGEQLAVQDFTWTSLLDEISRASALGDISNTTLAIADDVVARVSTLVECCLTLSSAPPPLLDLDTSPPPFHTTTSFIPEAYSWLLENIANPYPSLELKASLAQRYDSRVSTVSSWFASARRRMGWTALCRDFFHNCRVEAVEAAHRVLVEEDPHHQLSPEVIHALVAMKVTAEGLYATSVKSALVSDLDAVVKDKAAEGEIHARDDRRGKMGKAARWKECEEFIKKRSTHTLETQESLAAPARYISPDLSCSSLAPCFDDSHADKSEEDTSLLSLAGRKRRLSLSEPSQVSCSKVTARSVKRPRFSSSFNTCLPSPSTSTEEPLESGSYDQTSDVQVTQSLAVVNPRKHRLSDPHTGIPKHPLMTGTCPQVISDLLPFSAPETGRSIDEWFKANFDDLFALPAPADVNEPDRSTPWEVELFDNYIIPETLQKTSIPSIQDVQTSSTDFIALEGIPQSFDSSGFVLPLEISRVPTMASAPGPASQALSLPSSLSQPIDWTTLFDGDPCESASNLPFPQFFMDFILPEIDLSILQLPQVWTTIAS